MVPLKIVPKVATRSEVSFPVKPKPVAEHLGHRPFQEFRVAALDDLVKELEGEGQGVDVLAIDGVPHPVCGRPMAIVLVESDAVKHVPGDLLAIYQYCQGCKVAVRVL